MVPGWCLRSWRNCNLLLFLSDSSSFLLFLFSWLLCPPVRHSIFVADESVCLSINASGFQRRIPALPISHHLWSRGDWSSLGHADRCTYTARQSAQPWTHRYPVLIGKVRGDNPRLRRRIAIYLWRHLPFMSKWKKIWDLDPWTTSRWPRECLLLF